MDETFLFSRLSRRRLILLHVPERTLLGKVAMLFKAFFLLGAGGFLSRNDAAPFVHFQLFFGQPS